MILLEDSGRLLDVELLFAALAPGELRDGLEEGADDLGLHRLAADAAQAPELAIDLLAHFGGEVELGETLHELVEVVALVAVAELLLDRLHLLAQHHLALAVAQLFAHLGLDLLLGVEDGELALHLEQDLAQTLLDGEQLEELLAVGGGQFDVGRNQVGESRRLGGDGDHLLHELLREPGALGELDRALARLAEEGDESGVARVGRVLVGGGDRRGDVVAVALLIAQRHAAPFAVQHELHAGEAALHLPEPGDGADAVEPVGAHVVDVLALRDREHQRLRRAQGRLDGAQGAGAPGADRQGDPGKEHGVPQGQDRNHQLVGHRVSCDGDSASIAESPVVGFENPPVGGLIPAPGQRCCHQRMTASTTPITMTAPRAFAWPM